MAHLFIPPYAVRLLNTYHLPLSPPDPRQGETGLMGCGLGILISDEEGELYPLERAKASMICKKCLGAMRAQDIT